MLTVLIIIAVLLVWLVRLGYRMCANQVSAQLRSEEMYRQFLDKLGR